jgi:hypothetical protein
MYVLFIVQRESCMGAGASYCTSYLKGGFMHADSLSHKGLLPPPSPALNTLLSLFVSCHTHTHIPTEPDSDLGSLQANSPLSLGFSDRGRQWGVFS